jgi:short-subunit dehydrogenase
MELAGKTVLLTGATGGLGRAIATALGERDAKVILSSRRQADLDELAMGLAGGPHRTIVTDLANEGEALRLLEAAGDIDVLVANAGLPGSGQLTSLSQEHIERALRVNLEAPIRMSRELVPRLVERGSGHLVFISSLSGKAATARASVYCATKFGLRGFALALREDLRGTGVGASVVMPGAIRGAGMFADSGASVPAMMGTGTPEQVGAAVVRAIERNRAEVSVAPIRQRALTAMAANAPEMSGKLAGGTATKVAEGIASGQTDKR